MTIRVEDFGAVAYGGAVTLSTWWDDKRIADGRIASKDVLKKASFYTYLGVGLTATLMSVFGWMARYKTWTEKLSTGFLYDIPRFAYNMSKTLSAGGGRTSDSSAVVEAQRILDQRQQANRQLLAQGQHASRSYEPAFDAIGVV